MLGHGIREMVQLDAIAIHEKVTVPTLAIGGEKDLQSLPGDIEKFKDLIKSPIQTHVFSDLTHIMRADEKCHQRSTILNYLYNLSMTEYWTQYRTGWFNTGNLFG